MKVYIGRIVAYYYGRDLFVPAIITQVWGVYPNNVDLFLLGGNSEHVTSIPKKQFDNDVLVWDFLPHDAEDK